MLTSDRHRTAPLDEHRGAEPPSVSRLTRILIPGARRDVVIPTADIDWLSADGAYVVVHASNRRHVLRDSLASLLRRLDERQFVQVHRSAAVNLDRVRETRRSADGQLAVMLADGTLVDVSRRRADAVLVRLGRFSR